MQIKGQEVPMHDPRGKVGLGIGYAISPTGADHTHNMHDTMFEFEDRNMEKLRTLGIQEPLSALDLSPAKVRMFQCVVNWQHFQNCALICMFQPYDYNHLVELVNGATGWNTSVYELLKVGERALALARVFNARESYTAKDDIIPERLYEAFNSGPLKDKEIGRENMQRAIQTYYKMAGWDPKLGIPTTEKLQELDLEWVVAELDKTVTKK